MSGWPGATHSVDICEDLEDWSGANLSNMSDTEEEDTVRLVSVFNLAHDSSLILFPDLPDIHFLSQFPHSPQVNTRLSQVLTNTIQMTSSLSVVMSFSCNRRTVMVTGVFCVH